MKTVYLDNAATTPLREEVLVAMLEAARDNFGNPSSTHSLGRSAKGAIESSRKNIAKNIGCSAQEIVFTASATEATNWILRNSVTQLQIKHIITSRVEHHATLYTVQQLEREFGIEVSYVAILKDGSLDYTHLSQLLSKSDATLVSLMHINNETGIVTDIYKVARLTKQADAFFHCDTVQSVGKLEINLAELPIDFVVASAHKFHGPKGVGFAFIRKGIVLRAFLFGGEQEKGLRAGTEAVHQIVGMAKALELSYLHLALDKEHILSLKNYCWEKIVAVFPEAKINGTNTFYTILNVLLPLSESKTAMLLFNLDMKGIAVSRGSACQSGSIKPSHVLSEFLSREDLLKPSLRISFSHENTREEIDLFLKALKSV
ncbi:MAG: cysteine desulfurase [Flavobacterium sp.]|jgi:cysteine desulfurase